MRDYVGWTNTPFTIFGLVDYAGLAAEYIKAQPAGKSLGTKVTCLVTEGALADGTTKISVTLVTTKALGFVQAADDLLPPPIDFLNTPTIFGRQGARCR